MTAVLFIVLVLLTVLFIWAARRYDTQSHLRPRLYGGAFLFLVLAAFAGHVLYRSMESPRELSEYISVYPNLSSPEWVPQLNGTQYYIFRSSDTLDQILGFYEKLAAESGWEMASKRNPGFVWITMTNEPLIIAITATEKNGQSEIVYIVDTVGDKQIGNSFENERHSEDFSSGVSNAKHIWMCRNEIRNLS